MIRNKSFIKKIVGDVKVKVKEKNKRPNDGCRKQEINFKKFILLSVHGDNYRGKEDGQFDQIMPINKPNFN